MAREHFGILVSAHWLLLTHGLAHKSTTINSTTEETPRIKNKNRNKSHGYFNVAVEGEDHTASSRWLRQKARCAFHQLRGQELGCLEALDFAFLRAHHPSSTEAGHSAGSAPRLAVQEGSGLGGAACKGQKRNGELSSGSDPNNHLGQMLRKICSGV